MLNVGRTSVAGWEVGKNYPVMNVILKLSAFFDVSLDDFVKINMTEFGTPKYDEGKKSYLEKKIDQLQKGRSKNLYVPAKAYASYTERWDDEILHKELEPISIPFISNNVEARTFEVAGMSMYPLIPEGDLLVCLRHERHDTFSDTDIFVIITRSNGILVKFIRIINDHEVQLVSHNDRDFMPITIEQSDIREIWKAKYKITRHFAAGTTSNSTALQSRVERLEDLINKLANK